MTSVEIIHFILRIKSSFARDSLSWLYKAKFASIDTPKRWGGGEWVYFKNINK